MCTFPSLIHQSIEILVSACFCQAFRILEDSFLYLLAVVVKIQECLLTDASYYAAVFTLKVKLV